jgi:hypothetical protein
VRGTFLLTLLQVVKQPSEFGIDIVGPVIFDERAHLVAVLGGRAPFD